MKQDREKYNKMNFDNVEITDQLIIEIFKDAKGKINANFRKILYKENFKKVLKYLDFRFEDSIDYREILYRIFNGILEAPKCPICGSPIPFKKQFYPKTCSIKCANKLIPITYKETCQRVYGVDNISKLDSIIKKKEETSFKKYGTCTPLLNPEVQEKIKETSQRLYGVDNPVTSEKAKEKRKQTYFKRFGVDHPMHSDKVKEKSKRTNQERYGVDNPFQYEEFKDKMKETWKSKYGVENSMQNKEVAEKVWNSRKLNGTLSTSKIEEDSYIWLCEEYGKENIERQYKDSRYPWHCDFHIKTLDLFIEIQGLWTHGKHPFDENNMDDLELLEELKSKTNGRDFYQAYINSWTNIDIIKRNTAKENKINFIEIFGSDFSKKYLMDTIINYFKQREVLI